MQNPEEDQWGALIQTLDLAQSSQSIRPLLDWLSKHPSAIANVLVKGLKHLTAAKSDVAILAQDILVAFKTKREQYEMLRALVELIDAGNHLGIWRLCLPSIPVWQASPVSPFDALARSKPQQWRLICHAFEQALKIKRADWPADFELGLLYLSALIQGGLHAVSLLEALGRQIDQPLYQQGSWSWLELCLSWRQIEDAEHRRWFADPISELLWLGLTPAAQVLCRQKVDSGRQRAHIWQCINQVFKRVDLSSDHRPDTLTKLIELASYQQLLQGPIFLQYYNRRAEVSHSLKSMAWARVLGTKPNPDITPQGESMPDHNQLESMTLGEQDNDLIESPWYRELIRAIEQNPRSAALHALKALGNQPHWAQSDMRHHLRNRVYFLLDRGAKSGHKLAQSTVRHYLSIVGKRLVSLVEQEDLLSLTAEGFAALYQGVLDDAVSKAHQRNIGRALREFHHYLVVMHDVAVIHDAEVLGAAAGLSVVDANILTIEEYQSCLNTLRRYPPLLSIHTDLAEAAALIVMIAFRCGTRRMEVLRLRLVDLHIGDQAIELLIRPWDNRRLKTKSSTRKIPLHVFLTKDEQERLKQWHQMRVRQEQARPFSPQLFAVPDIGMDGINQEFLYPKLHQVMRQVTGDPTIRFHHLRHSFASWTTLRLFLANLPTVPVLFAHLPDTQRWLDDSAQLRLQLYGHQQLTRKDSHLVASLLGHASPDMSFEHYVHTLDLIEMLNRDALVDAKSRLSLAKLATPVPQRSLYNHGAMHDLATLMARSRRYKSARIQPLQVSKASASQSPAPNSPESALDFAALTDLQDVWAFLTHRAKHPAADLADVCERFGFSLTVAERYLARAQYLRDLEADKRHTPRHRVQTWRDEQTDTEVRGLIADWPRNKADEHHMQRFAPKLLEAIRHPLNELRPGVTVFRLLDYFVENAWFSRHELIFKESNQISLVQGYLDLLLHIGVLTDEISLHVFSPAPQTQDHWRAVLPEWAQKPFHISTPPNKRATGLAQAIGIKVIHPNLYEHDAGSQGFRVLLHLAAIKIYGAMSY